MSNLTLGMTIVRENAVKFKFSNESSMEVELCNTGQGVRVRTSSDEGELYIKPVVSNVIEVRLK